MESGSTKGGALTQFSLRASYITSKNKKDKNFDKGEYFSFTGILLPGLKKRRKIPLCPRKNALTAICSWWETATTWNSSPINLFKTIYLSFFLTPTVFSDYKTHFPLKIWEENGGASYSPNVAYLAGWGARGDSGVGFFFSYFPPLKARYILSSGVSYSPKNMVSKANLPFVS